MLYKSFLNNPNSSNENAYKSYKNKLTPSLWVAKRSYHEKQIEKLQATWKVSNRNNGKRGLPSNPKEIANLSGKWFYEHWPQFS